MRRIAEIFQIELPVAVIGVLEHAARDLDFAVRRAVDHVVERGRHVAEKVFEARSVGGLACEDKAAITFDSRYGHHGGLRITGVEVLRIAVLQRHCFEPAVEMIGPAVVAALEFAGIAAVVGDYERSAMGALIVDNADFAFGVAHQYDRFPADEGTKIIAGVFYLAFVTDIDPGDAKYPLQLEFEDRRVGIDLPMHPARPNEAGQIIGHWRSTSVSLWSDKGYRRRSAQASYATRE